MYCSEKKIQYHMLFISVKKNAIYRKMERRGRSSEILYPLKMSTDNYSCVFTFIKG